jgi:hypothetical protein
MLNLKNLKSNIEEEYYPFLNDLIKILVILMTTNILMFLSNPGKNRLFSANYIKLMSFILLGVTTYWLIVNKIIVFN